jgi:hypothetical protein
MKKIDKKEKLKSVNKSPPSKSKLKLVNEVNDFAENIIDTVREPLLVLDPSGKNNIRQL